MAQIWHYQSSEWVAVPLAAEAFSLGCSADEPIGRRRQGASGSPTIIRIDQRDRRAETWAIAAPPGIGLSVNGEPLLLGLRLLRNEDEIVVSGGARLFFSTEKLAMPEPFPAAPEPVFCARCKQEIGQGAPAVACPACGTWCHESAELACWTYAPCCPLCDQPTPLNTGYRWTPEGL